MSIAGIENSFIVKKAKNFFLDERTETGFKWQKKHQERSPIELRAGMKFHQQGNFFTKKNIFCKLF